MNPLATIIVNNYNYDQFLVEAIDSALAQTYSPLEVIVVDDGSTDRSRDIIKSYGDKIIPVFKENGGQASAFNAGFEKSKGEVIFFLDSDDVLFSDTVGKAVELLMADHRASKVHWPLFVVDVNMNKTGEKRPGEILPEGDFRNVVLSCGPTSCVSSPTSGNAWRRSFLEKIFPVPEDVTYYRTCADEYLYTLAPVFGLVKAIHQPQGYYRIHGKNIYSALSFDKKLELELAGHGQQVYAMDKTLRKHQIVVNQELWRENSWFHRLQNVLNDVQVYIPDQEAIVLIDNSTLEYNDMFPDRRVFLFPEIKGVYGGFPEDDDAAVSELQRITTLGARFVVVTWAAFWWLEHFSSLNEYLQVHFSCIRNNQAVMFFQINEKA